MHQGWEGGKSIVLVDALFLLRPSILIPCWTIFIIGNFQSGGGFDPPFFLGIIAFTLLMGGVYILNQIFDRESDRVNNKLFLLSRGLFPIRLAIAELIICWVSAFYLAGRVSKTFLLIFIIAWALGILYTTPPVKLKGKPILDIAANAIGYGILTFILGSIVTKSFDPLAIRWSLPYVLAVAGVFINTTIVDMEGDKRGGEKTTAILLGPKISRLIALSLVGLALGIAFVNHDKLAALVIIPSLSVFILAAIKQMRKFDILSFRLPPFILAVAAGIIYPPYLIFLAIVILAMRIYYKKRFDIVFPSPIGG